MNFTRTLVPLLLLLAGCKTSWTVHAQANPSPFSKADSFEVQPLKFGLNLGIQPAGEKQQKSFAGDKSAMTELFAAKIGDVLAADSSLFKSKPKRATRAVVRDNAPSQAPQVVATKYTVKPEITDMDLGNASFFGGSATTVRMRVKIMKSNKLIDEITIVASERPPGVAFTPHLHGASSGASFAALLLANAAAWGAVSLVDWAFLHDFSSGSRLRRCAKTLAGDLSDYLYHRVNGGTDEIVKAK